MNLENLNSYCKKIKKHRSNWHKDTLKYFLIRQMESMIAPELWNIYDYNEEKQMFEINGEKIDYTI